MTSEEVWALIRLLVALPLVLLLAYFGLRYVLAKNYSAPFANGSGMQVLDRLALGPKCMLCVVKVDRQIFLVAVSESKVELLKELETYPESPKEAPSKWLQRLIGRGVDDDD